MSGSTDGSVSLKLSALDLNCHTGSTWPGANMLQLQAAHKVTLQWLLSEDS